MSTEDNKELCRRFFEDVFNKLDQNTATEIISPSFVTHHPAYPAGIHGIEGVNRVIATFRVGLPDLQYTIQDMIAEGDKVVVRWIAHGTHQGTFLGIPPTGKKVAATGIDIFRIAFGKLEEAWVNSDILGLLQQIGAIPPMGGQGA